MSNNLKNINKQNTSKKTKHSNHSNSNNPNNTNKHGKYSEQSKHRNINKYKPQKINVKYSYLIASLLLLLILGLRLINHQPLIPGDESYKNLLLENTSGLFNLLIKMFSLLLGEFTVILSLLLGLLSLKLFIRLLSERKELKNYEFYAALLFIVNPIFLNIFTSINDFVIIIPSLIYLLSFSLRTAKMTKKEGFMALLLLLLIPLIRFNSALIIYSALFLTLKGDKNKKLFVLTLIILGLIIGFSLGSMNVHNLGDTKYFSELGSVIVPSLFMLLISLVGIIKSTSNKAFLGYLFLGASYLYSRDSRITLSLLAVYYSAIFLKYLYEKDWFLDSVRKASLLLTYCSFLFILLSSMLLLVNSQPSSDLEAIKGMTSPYLVAPNNIRFSLNYFTSSKALVETGGLGDSNNLVQRLYSTIRDKKAAELLTYLGTNQILITKEQLEDRWEREDEGLLFLLHNSDNFRKVFEGESLELWEYEGLPVAK